MFGGQRTSFTAKTSQSNESVTCARVAGTEVCGCHGGRKLIFTAVEIDFYHSGNYFSSRGNFSIALINSNKFTQVATTLLDLWNFISSSSNPLSIYFLYYPLFTYKLDTSKAFNSVPHALLLQKLSAINLNPHIIKWIQSYLSCREQYVVFNGTQSLTLPVVSGVPQGSVLGPPCSSFTLTTSPV